MNIAVPSVTVKNIENLALNSTGSVGVTAVAGTTAVAQVNTYVFATTPGGATDTVVVNVGSQSSTMVTGATKITAAASLAAAINNAAGRAIAVSDGVDTVTVTAATAGTALPAITFGAATVGADVPGVAATTAAAYDVSLFSGLSDINVSAVGDINVKGATTAAITAATTSGKVTAVGGSAQTVTAKGGFDLSGSTGAISVTDSAQGAVASSVLGGSTVSITSTSKAAGATTGTITVGSSTKAPTGDVTITSSIVEAKGTTNTAGGAIAVTGGEDVVITQSASKAVQSTALANGTITNAAVTVTGKATTKSVTVDSSAAVAAVTTILAVAAEAETTTAAFGALTAGETIIVNGLTFTSTGATTAAQAAAAFSNLTAGATNGPSTKGVYSGAFSTEGWTSGAVGGTAAAPTVTFTGTTAAARTDLADTGTAVAGISGFTVTNQGVTAVKAVGNTGVTANTVAVTDASDALGVAAGTITDVTAHNYTTLAVDSNALTNLTVLGGSGNITIGNALTGNTAKTLNLSVDGVTGGTLDDADVYTTLNVATKYTGASTTVTGSTLANVTSTSIDDLNVSGDKVLTLTSTAGMSGLINVAVTGTAGLSGLFAATTMKTIDTSGTTGKATITFDATKATYTGGAGVDAVTTSAIAPTKAISLGAGDDSLTLVSGTTAVTGAISGGDGTDTLVMVAADIVTADNDLAFSSLVTGFETLYVALSTGGQNINLTNMGQTSSVIVGASAGAGVVTLTNLASGGTVTQVGTHASGVTVSNALFGAVGATTDSVNLVMAAAAGFDGGTFTAANVETINLNATDTSTATGITAMTVVVTGDKATTLNVTGNAGAALTLTSSVKLATLDASASTGAVSATSVSTAAITMKGGSAADSFVANGTTASTLLGNGGADTLTTNLGLTTLTGGAGNDLFVIPGAAANGNVYTTITDATAGDRIQLFDVASGTEVWNTTAISLAGTASFSDYLNAASTSGTGATTAQISWFAFGGNTYIVEDASDSTSFFAGKDAVVALTGVVDLSAASLNGAADPILMIG